MKKDTHGPLPFSQSVSETVGQSISQSVSLQTKQLWLLCQEMKQQASPQRTAKKNTRGACRLETCGLFWAAPRRPATCRPRTIRAQRSSRSREPCIVSAQPTGCPLNRRYQKIGPRFGELLPRQALSSPVEGLQPRFRGPSGPSKENAGTPSCQRCMTGGKVAFSLASRGQA